jgi:hypothetical protein
MQQSHIVDGYVGLFVSTQGDRYSPEALLFRGERRHSTKPAAPLPIANSP